MTQLSMATPEHSPAPPHDHAVQFYDSDPFLAESVATFLLDGLRRGEPCVVVATAAHRELFTSIMSARGVDVAHEISAGRFVMLDADATLQRFMVGGMPAGDRFAHAIGAVFDQFARRFPGLNVRAYG